MDEPTKRTKKGSVEKRVHTADDIVSLDQETGDWASDEVLSRVNMLPLNIRTSGNSPVVITVNVAVMPPAEELAKYENAVPGAGEHIIAAADQQRFHRQGIENKLVDGSERRRDRSQLISGGLSFTGLIAATVLGLLGNPWIAGMIAVVAVGGPLAAQQMATTIAKSDMLLRPNQSKVASSNSPPQ